MDIFVIIILSVIEILDAYWNMFITILEYVHYLDSTVSLKI